jgi:hypothetical protein
LLGQLQCESCDGQGALCGFHNPRCSNEL